MQRISIAKAFVFIDERYDGLNDASFLVNMAGYDPLTPGIYFLQEFPGFYHGGKATFTFADSHAEAKRWRDSRTTPVQNPRSASAPGDIDVDWIQDHSSWKADNSTR
jgi:prepilin-type processing-associated H-X9-DG protein